MNRKDQDFFTDKVLLITGATGGIGRALAMTALDMGARVAVCGRRQNVLDETYRDYDDSQVYKVVADVSKESDCEIFVEGAVKHFGHIDVLINNAGISMRSLFIDVELEVLKQLMDINFWGTVYCSKYALPHLLKSQGIICSVSSIAGYRGLPGRTGYSASKFAMQGFSEALRTENLHSGVHVMWVCPGFTSSGIRDTALNAEGQMQSESPLEESKLMSAEECAEHILKAVRKKKRTLILTSQGKMTVFLNKLWPSLTDKLVYNHFKKEKDSPLN